MEHLQDLYKQKRSLELNWEQEHLNEGRYTLDMVNIDHKIREIINHIKLAETQEELKASKISDAAPQVSVAT